jgi:8-oxo-dGTP diphosphatase
VELGESVPEAVAREAREETGMDLELERLLDVSTDVHRDRHGRVKYHYVIVDYLARPVSSRVELDDESSSYGWFTPAEIGKMKVSRNTKLCVQKFVEQLLPSTKQARG